MNRRTSTFGFWALCIGALALAAACMPTETPAPTPQPSATPTVTATPVETPRASTDSLLPPMPPGFTGPTPAPLGEN